MLKKEEIYFGVLLFYEIFPTKWVKLIENNAKYKDKYLGTIGIIGCKFPFY